jgi:hypothetical protein
MGVMEAVRRDETGARAVVGLPSFGVFAHLQNPISHVG